MCMIRLNPHVQYDRFATGQRVSGRPPQLPICAVWNPHFVRFMFRNEAPVTETQDCFIESGGIQKASLQIDTQGRFNLALNTRRRGVENEQPFLGNLYFYQEKYKKKRPKTGRPRVSIYGDLGEATP